ncbi:glycoside hydrolase family 30 protein [Botryobasidium botryosum FD-172 SS1]|uniref:Glycoside hydrolase family 30 protein n=1 Tax=Botryobasidium botryosum (strain FD-172 SS1) TaxID=930990 RepID=A0A067MXB6_BOTB1|nr:glycoside hydrolase family 30 protein [Botryobasidium botryosum FD-172 SS1]
MLLLRALTLTPLITSVLGQQIYDIWETTSDNASSKFKSLGLPVINFVTPGAAGAANIQVNDGSVYQQMDGFGASLTDSSAKLLSGLKSSNSNAYWELLRKLWDVTDGANSAGMSVLRIPIGASDYSDRAYTYDDEWNDTAFSKVSADNTPSYVWTTLADIKTIQPNIKLFFLPWSPPAWLKDSAVLNGGRVWADRSSQLAQYLLKSLQAIKNKGHDAYAISIQNEPENSQNSYPTTLVSPEVEAQVGLALRTLLNNNGFSKVKIIGYEHNWDHAAAHPVTLMNNGGSAFAGAAFHCYAGTGPEQQEDFHKAYPNKEVYFTECSGSYGSNWWGDIKWNMEKIFIGAVEHWARTGMLWNIALDGAGKPVLPGFGGGCANGLGCRGVVTISGSNYSLNQEWYTLAHANRATNPRDANGPFGQRIGVTVGGGSSMDWALKVTAFKTTRISSAEWNRYSLVVMNWADNPVKSVTTTIAFRGKQATYTFKTGVTTLWWYAQN